MKIFSMAFKCTRQSSKVIYGGFGFKHLSDATQYYVHKNNKSYEHNTTLCQPIGESVVLFCKVLESIMDIKRLGTPPGDYYFNKETQTFIFEVFTPADYHENCVIDRDIALYRVRTTGDEIRLCAYDKNGTQIKDDMNDLNLHYKLLGAFCVLLAADFENNKEFHNLVMQFIENPNPDTFVVINEDFYQAHKAEDFTLKYEDVKKPDINQNNWSAFSTEYQTILDNKRALTLIDEVPIEKFSENEFTNEQKRFIPKMPAEFILPKSLRSICNAVKAGDAMTVLLHGPAGTGKTMGCRLICQEIRLPIMAVINCTENLDEFVLGKFIPKGDKIIFNESPVTVAIREGGAVVFEEINFAKPQHLSFLNSLLDDNGFVRLDNGDLVYRHKNFRFFATMNIGYFGTKELNQALYNRFNIIFEIAALSDAAIEKMLTVRVPECTPFVKKILAVYHKLQKKIVAQELDFVISPRNLENWARMSRYDGYIKAAQKTIIPIAKCDREFEKVINDIITLYKWS